MNVLPPEILNIICSSLSVKYLARLSMVSKSIYDSIFNDDGQILLKNQVIFFNPIKKYKRFITNLKVKFNLYNQFKIIEFPRLSFLDLTGCHLRDGDLNFLKDVPLKRLNVSSNPLTSLPEFSKLESIIIRDCRMNMIPSMPNLKYMYLKLTDNLTYNLSDTIKMGSYPNLTRLDVYDCYPDLSFLLGTKIKSLMMNVDQPIPPLTSLEYLTNYGDIPSDYTFLPNLKYFEGRYLPKLPDTVTRIKVICIFPYMDHDIMCFPNLTTLSIDIFYADKLYINAPKLETFHLNDSDLIPNDLIADIKLKYPSVTQILTSKKLPAVRLDRID